MDEFRDSFTDKAKDYMCNSVVRENNFYGLPKVHKSPEKQSASNKQKIPYVKILKLADLKDQ